MIIGRIIIRDHEANSAITWEGKTAVKADTCGCYMPSIAFQNNSASVLRCTLQLGQKEVAGLSYTAQTTPPHPKQAQFIKNMEPSFFDPRQFSLCKSQVSTANSSSTKYFSSKTVNRLSKFLPFVRFPLGMFLPQWCISQQPFFFFLLIC